MNALLSRLTNDARFGVLAAQRGRSLFRALGDAFGKDDFDESVLDALESNWSVERCAEELTARLIGSAVQHDDCHASTMLEAIQQRNATLASMAAHLPVDDETRETIVRLMQAVTSGRPIRRAEVETLVGQAFAALIQTLNAPATPTAESCRATQESGGWVVWLWRSDGRLTTAEVVADFAKDAIEQALENASAVGVSFVTASAAPWVDALDSNANITMPKDAVLYHVTQLDDGSVRLEAEGGDGGDEREAEPVRAEPESTRVDP